MKPYELTEDRSRNDKRAFHGMQAGIWTAIPGIVQSFNPTAKTCVIKPAIKAIVFAKDGTATDVALPLLLDCPVFFPSGGGCTLTFPIAVGDECLVVFSSRCIDAWWFSSGVQVQAEMRMHDLSDGFAFVGVSSLPNVQSNISTSAVQLRSNDGAAYVSINPTSHEIDVVTSGNIIANAATATITAPTMTLNGNVQVNGNLIASGNMSDLNGAHGSISGLRSVYNGHSHTDPQGGSTGLPSATI